MHDSFRKVRKRCGERRFIEFGVEGHDYHTVEIMVQAVSAYGSRSPLVFIRGIMTAAIYINDVF